VKFSIPALTFLLCAAISGLNAAQPPPAPYTAVEVDKFVAAPGVDFPLDYQSALAEDLARQISVLFQTAAIVHPGDTVPYGEALMRISGVITRFKPGSKMKRQLVGFGAGATVVEARVWFIDAATGEVLLNRTVKGVTWSGIAGGDARSTGNSLAKKIARFCNVGRLVESN
jgi:Domain of unknown function (DUF4410)